MNKAVVKRRYLPAAVLAVLITLIAGIAAFADEPVKLLVNGKEIKPDVLPQVINDRTMVPVRWVAEALGLDVEWDQDARTVKISSLRNDRRIAGLEEALAPKTPQEAADTWAEGVKTRNGALQYAVMSDKLREIYRADFEGAHWSTGVSSPWVDSYEVINQSENNGTYEYEVRFHLMTSTGDAGYSTSRITVVSSGTTGQWAEEKWCVDEINHSPGLDFE